MDSEQDLESVQYGYETCTRHEEEKNQYCKQCKVVECSDCILQDHPGHRFCVYDDALHSAIAASKQLAVDHKTAIQLFKEAMETVKSTSTSIEVKARDVAEEVRTCFKRYKFALEEKERKLLLEIDEIKQEKLKILLNQMEQLNTIVSNLTESSELLTESLDLSNKTSEIFLINKKVTEDLLKLQSDRSKLIITQYNNIFFNVSRSNNLLNAITEASGSIETSDSTLNVAVVAKNVSKPIITFGSVGYTDGAFVCPWGICCDKLGNIIIADKVNRVQIFNPKGSFLHKIIRLGNNRGEFLDPSGLAVTPEGNLVMVDKGNNRIQIFEMNGNFLSTFGNRGSQDGQFNEPWGVACNSKGHIVVADSGNRRIQLFESDGTYLKKFVFNSNVKLEGVAFLPNEDIVITDSENHRLGIVNSNLTTVMIIGEKGTAQGRFNFPQGVCTDGDGNIIVADASNNRVQVLRSDGNFLWEVTKGGQDPEELNSPCGVCINPEGRIVILQWNSRVHVV